MKTEHFNNLTEAEAERLAILMEECAEVVQICGKILRHGYESYNPYLSEKRTNRNLLMSELGDVQSAISQMITNLDIDKPTIDGFESIKSVKIKQFLHHQK